MLVYLLMSHRSHDSIEIYGVFSSFAKALEVRNLTRGNCEIAEMQMDQFKVVKGIKGKTVLLDLPPEQSIKLVPVEFELKNYDVVIGTYNAKDAYSKLKELAPNVRDHGDMIVGYDSPRKSAQYVAMAIKWEKA